MGPALVLFVLAASDPGQPLRGMIEKAAGFCQARKPGEIVVCAREKGDSPYRLPPAARDPGFQIDGRFDSVSRERHKLMDVGGAGAQQGACGATGAAGWTGCQTRKWKEANEQAGFPTGVHLGPVHVGSH